MLTAISIGIDCEMRLQCYLYYAVSVMHSATNSVVSSAPLNTFYHICAEHIKKYTDSRRALSSPMQKYTQTKKNTLFTKESMLNQWKSAVICSLS